jgi:protocatechuate 3,4-dioxygenase beta subunit
MFESGTVAKTVTDEDGNYKLTGLAAGRLMIMPLAKAFVVGNAGSYKQPSQSVNVAEGETVTKIDFALLRGGVVTGRITDAEGHPIIGERVSVVTKDTDQGTAVQMMMLDGSRNKTDDRGIYRVYGLGPGSYKVSVGQEAAGGAVSVMGMGGSQYQKTFYPGVQDEAKATIIEIKEGTEVTNVDISVGKPGGGFSVTGRVINADSGQPVGNIYIGHSSVDGSSQQLGDINFTGNQTDANGKFKLEGLQAGHYALFTFSVGQDNSTYSEPTLFEISDSDVSGIEIKLRRGATIAGVAVLENNSDPAAAALLQTVNLFTSVQAKGVAAPSYARSQIAADGSFRFVGLAPGKARIWMQGFPSQAKGLTLVRTELEGLEQPEGIEVAAGANVTGVRLVFAYGTGSIRGEVKLEGSLPEGMILQLNVRSAPGENRQFNRSPEIDARNHFVLENVPPGNYELTLRATTSDHKDASSIQPVKQNVTVTNGAEAHVTFVLDVTSKGGSQ